MIPPETYVSDLLRSLKISSRDLDHIRSGHENWPKWCFAPFIHWCSTLEGKDKQGLLMYAVGIIPWRYSRSIYRFDQDVYQELIETPFTGEIPEEVLLRLPEWSVFVEMREESVDGFFASLDYNLPGDIALRFIFCDTLRVIPFCLELSAGTVENCIEERLKIVEKQSGKGSRGEFSEALVQDFGENLSLVRKALSLLLYICSDGAEIRDRDAPDWKPCFPRPKYTKGRERLFPADRNRIVDVGLDLGAEIRESAARIAPSAPTGRTVRPHLRRGHWHGFWTGPRKENRDQQRFVLKWLPPTYVHGRGE